VHSAAQIRWAPVGPTAQLTSGERVASTPIEPSMHCGFRLATVGGETWVPVGPQRSPSMRRDQAGGRPQEKDLVSGSWTVIGADRARFDVTDPAVEPIPGDVVFMTFPPGPTNLRHVHELTRRSPVRRICSNVGSTLSVRGPVGRGGVEWAAGGPRRRAAGIRRRGCARTGCRVWPQRRGRPRRRRRRWGNLGGRGR